MNFLIRAPTIITPNTKIKTITTTTTTTTSRSYVLTKKFFQHPYQRQQQKSSCTKLFQNKYFSSSSNLYVDDDNTHNNNTSYNDKNNDNIAYYKWPIQYDYSILQLQHRLDTQTNENGQFPLYTNKELVSISNRNQANTTTATNETHQQIQKVSAVLVLLCCIDNIPCILFTKRSTSLNNHPGQISFPGGHYEHTMDGIVDNNSTHYNLIHTAIRETMEELVPINATEFLQNLLIFGSTSTIPSINNIPVQPIIGIYYKPLYTTTTTTTTTTYQPQSNNTHETNIVSSSLPLLSNEFTCNNDEVDIVFTVPLHVLYNTETIYKIPTSDTSTNKQSSPPPPTTTQEVAALHSQSTKSKNIRFNITHTPMFPSNYGPIWGLTAYIIQPILHRLLVPSFLLNQQQKKTENR